MLRVSAEQMIKMWKESNVPEEIIIQLSTDQQIFEFHVLIAHHQVSGSI